MSSRALTAVAIERVLNATPQLTIGVLGDLYLDRYLDIDPALTEPSIETGLDAYQIVRVRASPGAAGTVINNLVALGVGRVVPVSVIGCDGEGRELTQALDALSHVDLGAVVEVSDRRTPTYTKPMLLTTPPRELNRLDIHNRTPTSTGLESRIIDTLTRKWAECDAWVILDQVSLSDCGVVTTRVRECLADLGQRDPQRPILADSRARIGLFRGVCLKPNERECRGATGSDDLSLAVAIMAAQAGRTVFCTRGEQGIVIGEPDATVRPVEGYAVTGQVDPVGAGDSTSAGIVCGLAAGLKTREAAAFGCLVASITVKKLGTTGTASPDEVRARWTEVKKKKK